jgi:nucleotide-binding universal stress UspA family protein
MALSAPTQCEDDLIMRILVGIDDSPQALSALQWAEDHLAHRQELGLSGHGIMLNAWSPPVLDLEAIFDNGPLEDAAAELLIWFAQQLRDNDRFEQMVVKGTAAKAILSAASRLNADLIVVGSRGRSAVAQVLLGSVSRHIAARADRPVAVIPHPNEGGGSTTVVAWDGSAGAQAAMRWALDNNDGPISVVAAWSLPVPLTYDPRDSTARVLEQATQRELMTGVKEICGGTINDRIEAVVAHGDPRPVLLDPLRDPTQIVMGQRGRQGLSGVLLGSTVTYVASHSEKPVIVVPACEA